VLNGPRAYFLDPDGTVLEFIDLTSYSLQPILRMAWIIASCRPLLHLRTRRFILMVSGRE
jgi:hypothetical protein